jgi:IstB-like ATP binding protein
VCRPRSDERPDQGARPGHRLRHPASAGADGKCRGAGECGQRQGGGSRGGPCTGGRPILLPLAPSSARPAAASEAATTSPIDTPTTTGTVAAPSTPAQARLYQQLRGHLAALKLHTAAEHLPAVLDHAATEKLSLTAALQHLLALEVEATEARRLAGRLRFASLPTPATLEEFDYDAQPAADQALITELASCRYLESATNVLLIGPPGTGKTHLAVGLARKAAEAGYRTYFTSAADLATRCHRAAIGPFPIL